MSWPRRSAATATGYLELGIVDSARSSDRGACSCRDETSTHDLEELIELPAAPARQQSPLERQKKRVRCPGTERAGAVSRVAPAGGGVEPTAPGNLHGPGLRERTSGPGLRSRFSGDLGVASAYDSSALSTDAGDRLGESVLERRQFLSQSSMS